MNKIDILLPTKRWNALTRIFLSYMAGLATHSDIGLRLLIGDNSCNPEKHAFLNTLANDRVRIYPHETDLAVYGNISFLFAQSTAPYIQLFGDDDWVHPDWYDNISHFDETPQITGVTGSLLFYPAGSRAPVEPGDRFWHPSGFDRARDYIIFMLNEQHCNTFCFSIFKREMFAVLHSFLSKTPLNFQFHDQLLLQIALLNGPIKSVDNGLVAYNTKIDQTSSGLPVNIQKMAMDCGLPNWFLEFGFYLYGVEYATIYQFKELPDHLFEARNAMTDVIFQMFFDSFKPSPAFEEHLKNLDLWSELEKVRETRTAQQGVLCMHRIISRLNPELGERYALFINSHTHFNI